MLKRQRTMDFEYRVYKNVQIHANTFCWGKNKFPKIFGGTNVILENRCRGYRWRRFLVEYAPEHEKTILRVLDQLDSTTDIGNS